MSKTLGLGSQLKKAQYFHLCLCSFTHPANINCHSLGAFPEASPEDILSGSDGRDLMECEAFLILAGNDLFLFTEAR